MDEDVENVEDYLERTLHLQRRSVFLLDTELEEFGEDLITNLSKAEKFSDESLLQSVAETLKSKDGNNSRRIDALSVEITPAARTSRSEQNLAFRFRHSICITGDGQVITVDDTLEPLDIVCDILDDIIDHVVQSAKETKVQLYFFHHLPGEEGVAGHLRGVEGHGATPDHVLVALQHQRPGVESTLRVAAYATHSVKSL